MSPILRGLASFLADFVTWWYVIPLVVVVVVIAIEAKAWFFAMDVIGVVCILVAIPIVTAYVGTVQARARYAEMTSDDDGRRD